MFLNQGRTLGGLNKLIRKIHAMDSFAHQPVSGWWWTACTDSQILVAVIC